jgi:hypothetical protein
MVDVEKLISNLSAGKDEKTQMRLVFFILFMGVLFLLGSLFLFGFVSGFLHAKYQTEHWDTVNIEVSQVESCGKGRCLKTDYEYGGSHFTSSTRCTCLSPNVCNVNQRMDILVNPSNAREIIVKQCAMDEANETGLGIKLAAVLVFSATVISFMFVWLKKNDN